MKSFKRVVITISLLLLITGCSQQNNADSKFAVFANNENLNNESRETLLQCLDTEDIDYKLDNDKNVLIKNNDIDIASARCS